MLDKGWNVTPAQAGVQEASDVKCFWVYMLASKKNGTLYIGVTNDLRLRVHQHKCGMVPGFTKRYGVDKLVYFETFCRIGDALVAEKRLKKWNRRWKIRLIEEHNPQWKDLLDNESAGNGFPPARE